MPPSVQFGWVDGSGPNRRPCGSRWALSDVEDDAGLHDRAARLEVDVLDLVAVLRPVDHDGGVRALTGEAGAAAAGEQRGAMPGCDPDGGRGRVRSPGDDDAERDLAVVGASVE